MNRLYFYVLLCFSFFYVFLFTCKSIFVDTQIIQQHFNWKMFAPWKESYDKSRQHIKKQRQHFVRKGPSSQGYGFSSGHVWMWELDHKEGWAPKNWRFWTVMLEKILESPFHSKEFKPVNPKGNQPWIFTGRTDAETPILWPPDAKSRLIGKTRMLGKVEGRRRGRQRMEWLGGMIGSMDESLNGLRSWWPTGRPGVPRATGLQRVGHAWATEQLRLM